MPIYEYQCAQCGHQFEKLQKLSDEPLRVCTACGKEALSKLMSATNFQLKGSGWYKAGPTESSSSPETAPKSVVADEGAGAKSGPQKSEGADTAASPKETTVKDPSGAKAKENNSIAKKASGTSKPNKEV